MSKLNPQKATAYVGPGVLRKGGKITPVPNGPLIKKKGQFKGSTLKSGGVIKKAQNGSTENKTDSALATIKEQARLRKNLTDFRNRVGTTPLNKAQIREKDSLNGLVKDFALKQRVKGTGLSPKQLATNDSLAKIEAAKKPDSGSSSGQLRGIGNDKQGCSGSSGQNKKRLNKERNRKNGGPISKLKSGGMIKRADGSSSKHGLWDSIRANKGSGKKPTAAMLKQEKKIKAKK